MGKFALKLILYVEANPDHKNAFKGSHHCQEIELCCHFLILGIRQTPSTLMWDIKLTQVLWVKNCIMQIKIWEDFFLCYYQHSCTQILQGCLWTCIFHEYGFAFVVLQLRHHTDGFITTSYISFPSDYLTTKSIAIWALFSHKPLPFALLSLQQWPPGALWLCQSSDSISAPTLPAGELDATRSCLVSWGKENTSRKKKAAGKTRQRGTCES